MSASVSLGATIKRANSGFVAMTGTLYKLLLLVIPSRADKRQSGSDRGISQTSDSATPKERSLAALGMTERDYVLRTSSCRRRIQCKNPSNARVDTIKTLVLKTNTSTFIPKYCLYWPKNTFGFPPRR